MSPRLCGCGCLILITSGRPGRRYVDRNHAQRAYRKRVRTQSSIFWTQFDPRSNQRLSARQRVYRTT